MAMLWFKETLAAGYNSVHMNDEGHEIVTNKIHDFTIKNF
jgi:hypothetical protein